jgi:hypothetical protein
MLTSIQLFNLRLVSSVYQFKTSYKFLHEHNLLEYHMRYYIHHLRGIGQQLYLLRETISMRRER